MSLAECLQTLYNQPAAGINTWVVDNASSDHSLDACSNPDHVQLLKNTNNLGFAQACNQGAQQGTGSGVGFRQSRLFHPGPTAAAIGGLCATKQGAGWLSGGEP